MKSSNISAKTQIIGHICETNIFKIPQFFQICLHIPDSNKYYEADTCRELKNFHAHTSITSLSTITFTKSTTALSTLTTQFFKPTSTIPSAQITSTTSTLPTSTFSSIQSTLTANHFTTTQSSLTSTKTSTQSTTTLTTSLSTYTFTTSISNQLEPADIVRTTEIPISSDDLLQNLKSMSPEDIGNLIWEWLMQ